MYSTSQRRLNRSILLPGLLIALAVLALTVFHTDAHAATPKRRIILIGDSRTESMYEWCRGDSRVIWSFKSSMGYNWMKKTGIPQIENKIRANTAVVILMGVNDCADTWMADRYVTLLNNKAREWSKLGAQTYFISIPPVNDKLSKFEKNAWIKAFNKRIRTKLSPNVIYVDIYAKILSSCQTVSDGLHYRASTTKRYYQLVMNAVDTGRYTASQLRENPDLVVSPNHKHVYNFSDYLKYNPSLKEKYASDPVGAYQHFLQVGLDSGLRASKEFDPISYLMRYPAIRHKYFNNYRKYYAHYITTGRAKGLKGTKTTKMVGYTTVYKGVDYSKVYNLNDYVSWYPFVIKGYGYDDNKILADFVKNGMHYGRWGSKKFNWRVYRKYNPDLKKLFGDDPAKYYDHYLRKGYKQSWRRHV